MDFQTLVYKYSERYLEDSVVIVIYDQNESIALVDHPGRGFWFPYRNKKNDLSVIEVARKMIEELSIECEMSTLIKIYSTNLLPCSNHSVTYFLCTMKGNTTNIGEYLIFFDQFQLKQIQKSKRLMGLEPIYIINIIQEATKQKNLSIIYEPKMLYIESSSTNLSTLQEQLIASAKFKKNVQDRIFQEFFSYSYPSEYISLKSFNDVIHAHGLDTKKTSDYFRAFDVGIKHCLNFTDFLLGFAALEPSTQHGSGPAEQRCRYIYRFYNVSSNNCLTFEEFKVLVNDIFLYKKIQLDEQKLLTECEIGYRSFGLDLNEPLTLSDFLNGVGQLKFRGTSVLFRLPHSIIDNFRLSWKFNLNKNNQENIVEKNHNLKSPEDHRYELATHTVKVKRTGTLVDIVTLWDLDGATTPSIIEERDLNGSSILNSKPNFNRLPSSDCFNQESHPNEMLSGLRYFENSIKDCQGITKDPFSWGKVDMNAMGRCLILICKNVQELLLNEKRLLKIPTPCYILGDIHGNFSDLVCFEKTLWRMGPILTPASFLFLGDYVDRGSNGVEVISYLFSQKILCPNKFYLLRGNHELRSIQEMFHFHKECKNKFGDEMGNQIWEEVNKVFDCMPLAALVDEKIFCIHGGIPSPLNCIHINEINNIPCPLRNPDSESPLAWELLWNDPLLQDYKIDHKKLIDNNGFTENSRRGTGYYFSTDALGSFLLNNNISYVVRAHEVQQVGFKIQLGGKLLTVFSSSHYCGGSNEAAAVLVDSNKLRLIRLDTS